MFNYLIKLFVIFTVCVFLSNGQISDKRLCANQECTVAISEAKTIMSYGSSGAGMLSFKANENVKIYSKSAGSNENVWGAVIKGKRGYVPIKHLREQRVYFKNEDLKFVVDTEMNNVPSVQDENTLQPNKVKQPYEIHEGTKIFTDDINKPSISSESNIENKLETKPLEKEPQEIINDTENEEVTNSNIVSKVFDSISNLMKSDGSGNSGVEDEVDYIRVKGEDDEDDKIDVDGDEYDEVEDEPENEESEKEDDVTIQQNESKSEEGKNLVNLEENVITTEKIQLDEKKEEIVNQLEESVEKINETDKEKVLLTKEDSSKPPIHNLDIKISQIKNLPPPLFKLPMQEVPVKPIENVLASSINPTQQDTASGEKLDIENKLAEIENLPLTNNLTEEVLLSEHNSTQNTATSGDSENADKLPQNVTDNVEENKINLQEGEILLPVQEAVVEIEHSENNTTQDVTATVNDEKEADKLVENLVENLDVQGIKVGQVTVTPSEDAKSQNNSTEEVSIGIDSSTVGNLEKLVENLELQKNNEVPFSSTELPLEEDVVKPVENLLLTEEAFNIISDSLPDIPTTEQPSINYENEFNISENVTFGSENVEVPKESVNENDHLSSVSDRQLDNSDKLAVDQDNESSTQTILNSSDDLDKSVVENSETVPVEEKSIEENVAPQIENYVPNTRDILWGSTVRKEILEKQENDQHTHDQLISKQTEDEFSCAANPSHSDCLISQESFKNDNSIAEEFDFSKFNIFFINEVIVVLIITAVTVVVFLWGYMLIDKSRKEAPLISKINNLEKVYLVMQKENEILTEKLENIELSSHELSESYSNDSTDELKQEIAEIMQIVNLKEEQIQNLEKELSNSTEVGLELNRMFSEFLSSESGSTIVANVEQLQRQLIEQQDVINTCNDSLAMKDTENHELRLELEINNTKVVDLQSELNKMALNLLKIEEDKEQIQSTYSSEAMDLKNKLNKALAELKDLKLHYDNVERELEIKTNEYVLLRDSISTTGKGTGNNESVNNLVDISSMKAELLQLRKEKQSLTEKLRVEVGAKNIFEEQSELANQEVQNLKSKYDNADREKLEAQTKLEVLSNYFKEKEAQLQKDLSKQESLWIERQGEATSTTERIKYMQDELQNYKTQYESLKQEILSQEVDMKSQISVLEKRAHENWVSARQAERKLEDAKQEAAQLRNRLTLRERSFNEEKVQNQQNGDSQISPILNDGINNNSLMYNTRDHLTTSPPPLSGGLPPFMPPPPTGVAFMPPPLGGVPMPPPGFLPPPPNMMPGDHRPPPLGRMSSPPVNSRYSPDSRYSPFRRNSPSPTSEDDYDRSSPPPHIYRGGYNHYNRDDERRDFNRPPPKRNNVRHNKGAPYSSGSANSNESLEKLNRHNSKV